jgi:hypothetical protein
MINDRSVDAGINGIFNFLDFGNEWLLDFSTKDPPLKVGSLQNTTQSATNMARPWLYRDLFFYQQAGRST